MTRGTRNIPDWITVHGEGEEVIPVSVEDCYSDREPYGEYVLFAASDEASAAVDRKISILNYGYLAEVRVTFEEDLVADGADDIAWCQKDYQEQGDAFVRDVWPSWQDVPLNVVANSIFPPNEDFVMAKCVLAAGPDRAAWLEVTRIESGKPAEMAITYCRVQQDRLLEIKTVLKDPEVPVYIVANMWENLVDRFQDLPYEHLTGARRVEPAEDDLEAFDFDAIGDVAGEA